EAPARVLALVGGALFLDRTPFYAEAGGQIGDTGVIESESGLAIIGDTTYALPGLVRHRIQALEGQIYPGQEGTAPPDPERRDASRRSHAGSHLLHWALRSVLADHVRQQGSMVAPDRLRFDFSHYEAVSPTQLAEIEDMVAGQVLTNAPVRAYETSKTHA